jgi:hypothetical protein
MLRAYKRAQSEVTSAEEYRMVVKCGWFESSELAVAG